MNLWEHIKSGYFSPMSIEKWRGGLLFRLLGVELFKRCVIVIGQRRNKHSGVENNYFIWDRSVQGLIDFEKKTRYNEAVHLVSTLIPMMGLFAMIDSGRIYSFMFILVIMLVVINLWALLLQRYTRVRLSKVILRREKTTN